MGSRRRAPASAPVAENPPQQRRGKPNKRTPKKNAGYGQKGAGYRTRSREAAEAKNKLGNPNRCTRPAHLFPKSSMMPLNIATCHSASLDPCSFATSSGVCCTTKKKKIHEQTARNRSRHQNVRFSCKGLGQKKHVLRASMCKALGGGEGSSMR